MKNNSQFTYLADKEIDQQLPEDETVYIRKNSYVYIYLNPLKPGLYTAKVYDTEYSFNFEPFYVGEGMNARMYDHLIEARTENYSNNFMKVKLIKHIWNNELEPYILKIVDNLSKCEAKIFEAHLMVDLKTKYDCLTNIIISWDLITPEFRALHPEESWPEIQTGSITGKFLIYNHITQSSRYVSKEEYDDLLRKI
jgi:hypothetical protein